MSGLENCRDFGLRKEVQKAHTHTHLFLRSSNKKVKDVTNFAIAGNCLQAQPSAKEKKNEYVTFIHMGIFNGHPKSSIMSEHSACAAPRNPWVISCW